MTDDELREALEAMGRAQDHRKPRLPILRALVERATERVTAERDAERAEVERLQRVIESAYSGNGCKHDGQVFAHCLACERDAAIEALRPFAGLLIHAASTWEYVEVEVKVTDLRRAAELVEGK